VPLPSDTAFAPTVPAVLAAPAAATLQVGARDLGSRELVLLRSLLRLLDGVGGLRLAFAEADADAQVVFVPARWPQRLAPHCIVVRVVDLADDDPVGPGLHVTAPLRSSNVGAVLRAAAALVEQVQGAGESEPGLAALFHLLARHLAAQDRRGTLVALGAQGTLLLDFEARVVRTALPLDTLLAGGYLVAPAVRASHAERDAAATLPTLPLAELFWRAAQRLGDDGVAAPAVPGRVRLARWPDAVALGRPGLPRLAALLTSRPMSAAEAATASGLSHAAVHWFLQAGLALGIARPWAEETSPAAPPAPARPSASVAPRSLLGRLREHLKLW
jgi:hypothetical protein